MSPRLAAETGFERRIITKFLREESLGSMRPGWPVLVGQLSIGVMTSLVCLCGSPLAPRIGGVRGGHTFNTELTACARFSIVSRIFARAALCSPGLPINRL